MGASVRRISDLKTWSALRPQWDALFAASPTAAAPLHWDWLQTWWEVYGPLYVGDGRGSVYVLAIECDGRLIGGLPLYQSRVGFVSRAGGARWGYWRLGFPGTDEAAAGNLCAEYLDLLYVPGEEETCRTAVVSELRGPWQPPWDELLLNNISVRSLLVPALGESRGTGNVCISEPRTCPIADLAGGFEAYLGRVSSKRRGQFRRLIRDADRLGAVFEVATNAESALEYLQQLAVLHQQRWTGDGSPGCFASPHFEQFHRELVRCWASAGRAVLGRMIIDGQPLAVLYGFRTRNKFDYYQSGVISMPITGLESPGIAALLLFLRYLAGQGIECFDFLAGAAYYKTRMATGELAITGLTLRRPTLRMASYFAFDFGRRGLAKCTRVARRLLGPPSLANSIDAPGDAVGPEGENA